MKRKRIKIINEETKFIVRQSFAGENPKSEVIAICMTATIAHLLASQLPNALKAYKILKTLDLKAVDSCIWSHLMHEPNDNNAKEISQTIKKLQEVMNQ